MPASASSTGTTSSATIIRPTPAQSRARRSSRSPTGSSLQKRGSRSPRRDPRYDRIPLIGVRLALGQVKILRPARQPGDLEGVARELRQGGAVETDVGLNPQQIFRQIGAEIGGVV